jgi:hypothetical protein
MQQGPKMDGQIRALAIALSGAAVMSVVAMFIPASIFETITGATGISELVPATGAPLGDTARALIAFGFGALTFAFLAAYLLRKPVAVRPATGAAAVKTNAEANITAAPAAAIADDSGSFMDRMRAKISAFNENRRNGDDVKELSDLPKLRAGDAHPDAPPRRPISAHRDFGEVPGEAPTQSTESVAEAVADEANIAAPIISTAPEVVEEVAPIAAPTVEPVAVMDTAVPEIIDVSTAQTVNAATLESMVDRLENAVAQRQQQLEKLEALASAKAQPAAVETVTAEAVAEVKAVEAEIIPPAPRPMSFAALQPEQPEKSSEADEMDAALRSALETLHRMNARTR